MPDADDQAPTDPRAKTPPDAGALVAEIFDEAAAEEDSAAVAAALREAYSKGGAEWKPEHLLALIDAATEADDEADAP